MSKPTTRSDVAKGAPKPKELHDGNKHVESHKTQARKGHQHDDANKAQKEADAKKKEAK